MSESRLRIGGEDPEDAVCDVANSSESIPPRDAISGLSISSDQSDDVSIVVVVPEVEEATEGDDGVAAEGSDEGAAVAASAAAEAAEAVGPEEAEGASVGETKGTKKSEEVDSVEVPEDVVNTNTNVNKDNANADSNAINANANAINANANSNVNVNAAPGAGTKSVAVGRKGKGGNRVADIGAGGKFGKNVNSLVDESPKVEQVCTIRGNTFVKRKGAAERELVKWDGDYQDTVAADPPRNARIVQPCQEDYEPVFNLNRHGQWLAIIILLSWLLILAKMIATIYFVVTLDNQKLDNPWMTIVVITLHGIGFFAIFLVLVPLIILTCVNLEDAGDKASMLWHRLMAGCLSNYTLPIIVVVFIILLASNVFEALIDDNIIKLLN